MTANSKSPLKKHRFVKVWWERVMVQAGFIMHQNVDVIERLRRSGCKGQRRISLLRVIEFENASAGIERIPFNTKSLHQRNVQVA